MIKLATGNTIRMGMLAFCIIFLFEARPGCKAFAESGIPTVVKNTFKQPSDTIDTTKIQTERLVTNLLSTFELIRVEEVFCLVCCSSISKINC